MTRNHLLDASALLALIRNEPGRDRVRAVLDDSQIHSVNLAEVARKMVSKGMPAAEVESLLDELRLDVVEELSSEQALAVGRLGLEAKRLGLSLGDCVCLAVAEWIGATAVTADRRWAEVTGIGIKILQVRPA
jgi:ribonuclease VapC